jgi:hypothetical protein
MKQKVDQNRLPLDLQLRALDLKDRKFRDRLDEEQQKKFSPYLMMRYAGNVEGSADLQSYYILAANEQVNKYFFDISKHPELQWLCCTTVSPGMGSFKHYWLNNSSKKTDEQKFQNKVFKKVCEMNPSWKVQDVELWIELTGEAGVKQWLADTGEEEL